MEKFTFVDRPDYQRIRLMADAYSKTNPEIAELFINFQWTYRNMQKAYDRALENYNLSESRFIILMFLKNAPNHKLSPSDISDKLGATRATVSKLLKAMEIKGWIVKQISNTDKRALPVKLTEEGSAVLEAFLPTNFDVVHRLLGGLSAEEIQQFSHLLDKIKKRTQKCILEMEK